MAGPFSPTVTWWTWNLRVIDPWGHQYGGLPLWAEHQGDRFNKVNALSDVGIGCIRALGR